MINVVIIEDEESAFQNLKSILLDIDSTIKIVRWLQSVEQSINWFKTNSSPDLLFLDIQLSDDVSFKIFESVEVNCPIVFTTAFDEYAIKAFELNSIDYLLKPITKQNVEKSISKYLSSIQPTSTSYDKIIQDLKKISTSQSFKERFLVNKADELVIIPTSEIAYFYKEVDTYIVAKNGDIYPIKFTLVQLVALVDPAKFYRINRQLVVHIDAISKITLWFNGKLKLQLTPKFEGDVFVSRDGASSFKSWMDK
jgi:DNA-binding LytR/AlgR family response regulator